MLHNFPASRSIGIMEQGPTVHVSDLGIVPSMPRSRRTRGPGGPRAAAALMLLPHTGNLSGAYRGLPAQTVIFHNR